MNDEGIVKREVTIILVSADEQRKQKEEVESQASWTNFLLKHGGL